MKFGSVLVIQVIRVYDFLLNLVYRVDSKYSKSNLLSMFYSPQNLEQPKII